MSDAIFTRLRALLGTTGVERDANGVPRATPDSSDALSLVCRLAHEEGWKIRVEGRGTWLPPDAPADLVVSTCGLEQIVSVSPADLVATVQAGTSLEAVRRRLAMTSTRCWRSSTVRSHSTPPLLSGGRATRPA